MGILGFLSGTNYEPTESQSHQSFLENEREIIQTIRAEGKPMTRPRKPNAEAAARQRAMGTAIGVVIKSPTAARALADLTALHGSQVGAITSALIAASPDVAGEVLDRVLLCGETVVAWHRLAAEAARRLPPGTDPTSIPDARAREQADGSLLIWADLPGERVQVVVPRGQWAWQGPRNS